MTPTPRQLALLNAGNNRMATIERKELSAALEDVRAAIKAGTIYITLQGVYKPKK